MWASLKKIGWRIAGLYFWLYIIALLFEFKGALVSLENSIFLSISSLLESVGATPVNSKFLPGIIKIGWILFIVEFKPLLFFGFLVYLIVFPIAFVIYIFRKLNRLFKSNSKISSQNVDDVEVKKVRVNSEFTKWWRKWRKKLPTLSVLSFLLLAWFLVFGDAISTVVSIIGVFLSGALFFVLLFRLFIKTKPPTQEKYSMFSWIEYPNTMVIESYEFNLDKKNFESLPSKLSHLEDSRKCLLGITKYIKRKSTIEKIPFLVLVEFIINLVMVATCAILFWGLVIKTVDPKAIDLVAALTASLSYFLPGIDAPQLSVNVPLWIKVGTSATSWILFVIYISVAGNIIPDKQGEYTKQLLATQKTYRKTISFIKSEKMSLKEALNLYESTNSQNTQKQLQNE